MILERCWKANMSKRKKRQQNKKQQVFYAVKIGRKKGIYGSLRKAQRQVVGYSGGLMKKFDSLEEAKEYMGYKTSKNKKENNNRRKIAKGEVKVLHNPPSARFDSKHISNNVKPLKLKEVQEDRSYENMPTAFVDGSYMENVEISSYGYTVEYEGQMVQRDFGLILDQEILTLKSLGSELYACLRAMEWGIANNFKEIRIVYDCEGILDVIRSNKKNPGRLVFLTLFEKYSEHIQVYFRKANNATLLKKHEESHHLSRYTSGIIN